MGRTVDKIHFVTDTLIAFRCPACDLAHHIETAPGGWVWNGDTLLTTLRPSLLVHSHERWQEPPTPRCHSFVTGGRIYYLNDCTHALAGQTVDIPEWGS